MSYDNFIILIPALDPDESMIQLIIELKSRGFHRIVITDDGSKEESQKYFHRAEELWAVVIRHNETMGKGKALRTALKTADVTLGHADFYITADCDGQHSPEDIEKIACELLDHPDHFVIGVRKFEKTKGKKVSFWINRFQSIFFRMTNNGRECPDPRCGLRGFPSSLKSLALCTEGKSYDYEMNFLDAAARQSEVSLVPIASDPCNKGRISHFRPVVDLFGMYIKFWRYLLTSNIATIFDLILFITFHMLFDGVVKFAIFISTICARIVSGLIGYFLNRYISFRSHLSPGKEMVRYFIVFIGQMAASGILVSLFSIIPIPTIFVKIIVDFCLFFVVYNVQKSWVFAPQKADI